MATKLMRADLRPLYEAATGDPHPGLLLQRGLAEHDDDADIKKEHVERICASTAGDFYRRAYDRWTRATADAARFRSVNLKLRTRLFIGLTGGGMLETGCAISRAHGTPYIPGSSVKGIVAAHAEHGLGPAAVQPAAGAAAHGFAQRRPAQACGLRVRRSRRVLRPAHPHRDTHRLEIRLARRRHTRPDWLRNFLRRLNDRHAHNAGADVV